MRATLSTLGHIVARDLFAAATLVDRISDTLEQAEKATSGAMVQPFSWRNPTGVIR